MVTQTWTQRAQGQTGSSRSPLLLPCDISQLDRNSTLDLVFARTKNDAHRIS